MQKYFCTVEKIKNKFLTMTRLRDTINNVTMGEIYGSDKRQKKDNRKK